MPLTVFCCCTYRTSGRDWTQRDWAACFFIKALKGKPLKGYARIPLPTGRDVVLDKTTAPDAPLWFADIAHARIRWPLFGAIALIPIPDSVCALNDLRVPRTLPMASALAEALHGQAAVIDTLRWDRSYPSAHRDGGTRDPAILLGRIRLARPVPTDRSAILIDDVVSSGGHLRAAASFLITHGCRVGAAICAGRSDNESVGEDAFAMRIESLPDLELTRMKTASHEVTPLVA